MDNARDHRVFSSSSDKGIAVFCLVILIQAVKFLVCFKFVTRCATSWWILYLFTPFVDIISIASYVRMSGEYTDHIYCKVLFIFGVLYNAFVYVSAFIVALDDSTCSKYIYGALLVDAISVMLVFAGYYYRKRTVLVDSDAANYTSL